MVEHTQRIRWLLLTNCLSVFDYFVGLALKGLKAAVINCFRGVFKTLSNMYNGVFGFSKGV